MWYSNNAILYAMNKCFIEYNSKQCEAINIVSESGECVLRLGSESQHLSGWTERERGHGNHITTSQTRVKTDSSLEKWHIQLLIEGATIWARYLAVCMIQSAYITLTVSDPRHRQAFIIGINTLIRISCFSRQPCRDPTASRLNIIRHLFLCRL